jgi:hypothetical protein
MLNSAGKLVGLGVGLPLLWGCGNQRNLLYRRERRCRLNAAVEAAATAGAPHSGGARG